MGCFFFLLFTRPGVAEENRHPIPSQEQQEEIRKLIRDAYVAPEGDQLLKDALDNTDLDQQYVLLNEAGRLFIDELDVNSALKTANILSQRFAKDQLAIQYKIIKAISTKSRKKGGHTTFSELLKTAPSIAEELISANKFEQAIDTYEIALDAARKNKNKKMRSDLQNKITEAKKLRMAHQNILEYLETLQESPGDPESNYRVGSFYCFERNLWQRGLPYLARGNDDKISSLAKLELNNPTKPSEILDVADQWWELAAKQKKPYQAQMKLRAKQWYAAIFLDLQGLNRQKILRRLAEGKSNSLYIFRDPEIRGGMARNNPRENASKVCIDAALQWLAARQNKDGSWSFDYSQGDNCSGFANPGDDLSPGNSPKIAATGLVLLCFLSEGYTHQSKENNLYQSVVSKALEYLVSRLNPNTGRLYDSKYWHYHMYSQGIAACALAEAYGMSRDRKLKAPTQKAIDYISAGQKPTGGWHYTPTYNGPGDTSVFGWQIRALKSAAAANLKISKKMGVLADAWLDKVGFAPAENGSFSRYGYMENKSRSHVADNDMAMTAIGLVSRGYLGASRNSPGQIKGIEWLVSMQPARDNVYCNYYATMAVHQNEGGMGDQWMAWRNAIQTMLINSQLKQGPDAGTWYYSGNHGHTGGRLMSTCLATLILQNEYRYINAE